MLLQYVKRVEEGDSLAVLTVDAAVIHARAPTAVLCSYTALVFYGYTDRPQARYYLALEKGEKHPRLKLTRYVKWRERSLNTVLLGLAKADFGGGPLLIYDRDRMICDCIRDRARMDKTQYEQALKAYIADPRKSVKHLTEYAKTMGILRNVGEELSSLIL